MMGLCGKHKSLLALTKYQQMIPNQGYVYCREHLRLHGGDFDLLKTTKQKRN